MHAAGARTIPEFILRTAGPDGAAAGSTGDHMARAMLHNTRALVDKALAGGRYRAARNRKPPRKLGTHLWLWDCLSCSKCIPACPNDAVFEIEVEPFIGEVPVVEVSGQAWRETGSRLYRALKSTQIAIFADACNDCGNCDVYCPESGGPHIEKPRFFASLESWTRAAPLTGFVLTKEAGAFVLRARMPEGEFTLSCAPGCDRAEFEAPAGIVTVDWNTHKILAVRRPQSRTPPLDAARGGPEPVEGPDPESRAPSSATRGPSPETRVPVDLSVYMTLRLLLHALSQGPRVNFVNAAFVE
jgi:ferredoxin